MRNFEKSAFLVLFLLAIAGPLHAQTGIRMEMWQGATLGDPQDLANNPNLLGPPTSVTTLTGLFEAPMNMSGNFVARYTGCLTVPMAGTYNWWLVSNKKAKLWLQLDILNFAGKAAHASSMSNPPPPARAWDYSATQKGTQIMSTTRTWCAMAVQIEDDGDNVNHLAVGWYRPGTSAEGFVRQYERPVPATRFVPTGYPPPPAVMTINFTASPATITAAGQQTTLNWDVTNGGNCSASSDPSSTWTGSKPNSGSLNLTPFLTTTYSLSCTPTSGGASQTVSRTVTNNVYANPFQIAWTASADHQNVSRYRVLFSTTPGTYFINNSWDAGLNLAINLSSNSFPSTGTYYFIVVAEGPGGTSDYSNEVSTFVYVPGT